MATTKKKAAATSLAAKAAPAGQAAAAPAKAAGNGPPTKPAAKPARAGRVAKAEKPEKPEKAEKPRKPKLVRDSFTIPKGEYAVLQDLKQRAGRLGRPSKKSEVLRAGVQALAAMTDAAFLARVSAVPTVKTGRPAKA